ncbi:predicted protein [Naegleria gruberi]|uniref:DNA topoisomerase n=1 Tax=Naegleria gruberi TaxID=5762 RepID=D2VSX3_NAEGR|nr:uncharacterized protein NAEGRDRAFT_81118 [Naegleria gruberi]EFC39978.1 predicted protein [Naegleria gruberi]|eukprot:XP_002672722.1 predicted protein [Naegleria gruberi strain NEG-M]
MSSRYQNAGGGGNYNNRQGPHQKVLCVAEKPEAAKQIATILSAGKFQRREGKSKFNKIFEFEYRMNGVVVTMSVTSVLGHLMELGFDPKLKSWTSCDPITLMDPATPVFRNVPEKNLEIQQNLEQEARYATKLLLWLDCDREGENIAFEVIEVCKKVNRSLSIENDSILRARFSEFTAAAINRAIRNLERPNVLDSMAVDTRQELDLRIGASFTRFQSLRLKKKFQGITADYISYGPCQFPTLGFVVKRDLIIKNFESESFWTLNCTHDMGEEGKAQFLWKRGRLFDQLTCLVIYELCVEAQRARVVNVEKKRRYKYRPDPLNTIELQKLASQKLKMGSHETMKVAESLYNKGFISYPRTETNNYNQFQDDDLKRLVNEHTSNPTWGGYASDLLNGGYQKPPSGKQDDKAHPPIHPLKGDCNSNDSKEQALYELIARHFLACCSKDAVGAETKVIISIANEEFTCSGLMVEQKNFLEIWKYDRWSDKSIPVFNAGQEFIPTSLLMDHGETRPPPHLSESDLISAMDSNGIGTDATVAQHIKTIQERGYVIKKGNRFEATNLGMALLQGYDLIGYELSTPNLRSKMEKDMLSISKGEQSKEAVIHQSLSMYKHVYIQICKSAYLLDKAVQQHFPTLGEGQSRVLGRGFSLCSCKNPMDLKEQDGNNFLHCKNCSDSYPLPSKSEYESIEDVCPICNFQILNIITQKNTSYKLCPHCFNNPPEIENSNESFANGFKCFNCTFTGCKYSRKKDAVVRKCQKCSNNLVVRQRKNDTSLYIGCKGFPNCKSAVWLPKSIEKADLTTEKCNRCSTRSDTVYRLKFTFAQGTLLPPGVNREHTTCVFCDQDFDEAFNINLNSLNGDSGGASSHGVLVHNSTSNNRNMPNRSPTIAGGGYGNRTSPVGATGRNIAARQNNTPPPNQMTLDRMLGKRTRVDNNNGNNNSNPPPQNSYQRNNTSPRNQFGNNHGGSGSGDVVCTNCSSAPEIFTCKQGENQGRQFYKCPNKDKDEACKKFFKWVD